MLKQMSLKYETRFPPPVKVDVKVDALKVDVIVYVKVYMVI